MTGFCGDDFMRVRRAFFIIGVMGLLSGPLAADFRLVPHSVEDFLIDPGVASGIAFRLEGDSPPESVEYLVRNYAGGVRYRSSVSVSEEGDIEVSLGRPRGYHELYFPETEQAFGIGAIAPFEGETDDFFGIDAALSWLTEDERREGLIANLARGGIGIARERVDWQAVNPRPGEFNWHARETQRHPYPGGYERVRMTYDDHGIEVLDVFHSAPGWIRERTHRHAYPEDLVATSDAWQRIGERWKGYLGGMEVWNEPDIHFGGYLPADQYVPVVRAMRHAWDEAEIDVPLGGGGFALFNRPYLDLAARNRILDELDYVSFHFYGDPLLMEDWVGAYRQWLSDYGAETMPLWITESGGAWHHHESRPPLREQRAVAMKYAMNAVEAKAAGVARYFAFVYPRFSTDGNRNLGMTDEHGTPLRSLMGYFQAVASLSHKEYSGDLILEEGQLSRIRAFKGSGDESVLVFYSSYPTRRQTVTLPFEVNRVAGIDGRELAGAGGRRVTVSDGIVYAWANTSDVERYLDRETPAAEMQAAGNGGTGNRAPASPVILQPRLDVDGGISANQIGYFIPSDLRQFTLPVRVHNLGDQPVSLDLQVREMPGNLRNVRSLGRSRMEVPANDFRDTVFEVAPALLMPRKGVASVEVHATSDEVERIAPLVVNLLLRGAGEIEDYAAAYPNRQNVSLVDPERRVELSSGPSVEGTTMFVTREGHWRISGNFTEPGNSSLSVELSTPSDIVWDEVDAILFRVRFDRATMVRLRVWSGFGTAHYAVNRMIKSDGDWAVFLFPLNTDHFYTYEDLNDQQIERMRRGLTPLDRLSLEFTHLDGDQSDNRLEISDILFIGGNRDD